MTGGYFLYFIFLCFDLLQLPFLPPLFILMFLILVFFFITCTFLQDVSSTPHMVVGQLNLIGAERHAAALM